MKFFCDDYGRGGLRSPPSRGAWIEISFVCGLVVGGASPPSRGAWIEISLHNIELIESLSPPSRGAWIEMLWEKRENHPTGVAPLAGGVD